MREDTWPLEAKPSGGAATQPSSMPISAAQDRRLGATIIAPITVAVEWPTTPAPATTAASTSRLQKSASSPGSAARAR
jgi:hypothetical protein